MGSLRLTVGTTLTHGPLPAFSNHFSFQYSWEIFSEDPPLPSNQFLWLPCVAARDRFAVKSEILCAHPAWQGAWEPQRDAWTEDALEVCV